MKKTPMACATLLALSLSQVANASGASNPQLNHDDTYLGVGIGAVIGAIIAGPPGAAVGASLGGTLGWSEGVTSDLSERLQNSQETLKTQKISLHQQRAELQTAQHKIRQLTRSNALQESRIADLVAITQSQSPDDQAFLESIVEHYAQQIHFRKGDFHLPKEASQRLDGLSKLLNDHPNLSVSLKAHADQTGSDTFNAQLSQARADQIKSHLFQQGVRPGQVSIESFGESQAKVPLGDSSNYVLDRRVSIELNVDALDDLSIVSSGEVSP